MAATIRIIIETTGGLDKVKADVADLGESAKRSGGGFSSLQEIATGALREIGSAAINLAGAGLQKLGGFLVDSVKLAGDFESGMNSFGAAAGKGFEPGTEALGKFKDLFIDLGKELPVSTKDVQAAATALVKGGLSPAVIEAGALRDSLNFAAAAGMDLSKAAELTIKQLGTFVPMGASVEEQTKFMAEAQNLLVKAAGASTLDVDKLGDAMLAAAGSAKASGVDYKDFVTTMGLISPSFGSAAEAGTSYKNFLSRLIPTTKSAISMMQDLGLATADGKSKFYDANGAFIGNAKAAQLLKEKMGGLTAEQRSEAMSTIFGNDAKGAAIALMDAGGKGYDIFAQKMEDANGVQAQSAAVQQGFNFQWENMKGSLEALQITIGTKLLPVLASLIGDYITPGINAVMGFVDAVFATGDPLSNISQMIDDILPGFSSLVQWVQTAINDFFGWGSSSQAMSAALGGVSESVSTFGQITQYVSDLWTNTLQPALMTVWGVLVNQVWPILQNLATALFPMIGAAIQILAGFWTDVLIPAVQMLWGVLTTVVLPVLAALAGWLRDNLPGAIQAVTGFIVGTLFPALHGVYDYISQNVIPILADIAQWLIANVPIAIQATVDFVNTVLIPAFQAIWSFVQLNILPIFAELWTWLSVTLPAGVQVLANFWNQTLLPAINAVWTFLNTYIIPIFTALVNLHLAVLGLAVRTLTAIWQTELLPAITGIWNFIKINLGPIFQWLNDMVLHPLILILGDIYATVLGSINPILVKLADLVKGDVTHAFNSLNSFAGAAAGALSSIGTAVQGVIKWINDLVSALNSVSVPDWLQGHSPPPMADWFSYISESIGAVNAQLPTLQMNLAAQIGPSGQSVSNTASTRSFTYAPQITSVGGTDMPMDLALASSLASV